MKLIPLFLLLFFQNTFAQKATEVHYPESFILLKNEIPNAFEIKEIDEEIIKKGFQGNPGFLTDELIERAFFDTQKPFFNKVYVAVYVHKENQSEIVITAFKLNKSNTFFNEELNQGVLLIKEDNLIMLSSMGDVGNHLITVTDALVKRTGLKIITQSKDLPNAPDVPLLEKEPTTVQLAGAINSKVYGIIHLNIENPNKTNGFFLNTHTGEKITLEGSLDDGIMKLEEYKIHEGLTGYFEGEYQKEYYFGSWISSNRKTEVPFIFKQTDDLFSELILDEQFKKNVTSIENAIKNHNWKQFISLCDEEHHTVQTKEVGIIERDYIYEILGIKSSKTELENFDKTMNYTSRAKFFLDNIIEFKIDNVELNMEGDGFLFFSGFLKMAYGKKFPFRFRVTSDYKLISGFG